MPKYQQPKYSSLCQSLINAVQAAETVDGVFVVVNQAAAAKFTTHLTPNEFQLFDINHHSNGFFQVNLKPTR